ncbi:MAG: asparaginase [Gammaproteobacteria bacterium]|nr:asparaginase [Gammaproteobacteria bacterium]
MRSINARLRIITTGGTIDKIYFDAKSEFQVGDPQIVTLLAEANVSLNYTLEPLLRKDSLELTDEDRQQVAERVSASPEDRILITHGTDTMVDTARALLPLTGKTIVLTGSMQPARLRVSDAVFNIGYAIAAVQLLPPGTYIAINGQLFDPRIARKNIDRNRFEINQY